MNTITKTARHTEQQNNRKQTNNLGRFAAIQVKHEGSLYIVYGNVIDLVHGTDKPKRVRIQRGLLERHGEVVNPSEYTFKWWADEEED
jgi:hypothetical protein